MVKDSPTQAVLFFILCHSLDQTASYWSSVPTLPMFIDWGHDPSGYTTEW